MLLQLTLSVMMHLTVPRADSVLRIGVPHHAGGVIDSAAMRGITLGVEEAERTGALFHWSVVLVMVGNTRDTADVILVGGSAGDCAQLSHATATIVFNIGCRDDALRDAHKYPRVFHIEVSTGEYRDRGANALWHASLTRFGAEQLNERYRRRFGLAMTPAAWAGWFAVKVALESVMRSSSRSVTAISAILAITEFDGHKGEALRFSGLSHQLMQPLYVVNGARVSEAR